jgi:cyanate permease
VLLGWTALSLLAAVGWSRFMTQVRHKEHRLAADRARRVWRARRERDRLARAS